MFRKAVAGITSHLATKKPASSHGIPTDVAKIVPDVADRCCASRSEIDPLGIRPRRSTAPRCTAESPTVFA